MNRSGTGILSMFAAQAGAGHVYGVDSSGIIEQARLVVAKNGFQGQITLIHGKVSTQVRFTLVVIVCEFIWNNQNFHLI